MNKQNPDGAINWTRVWGRDGFTANPLRGCSRGCRWHMPDGSTAICYAETLANRLNKMSDGKHYKDGFATVTYHPDVFDKIKSRLKPSGIFIDSMSDLFDGAVSDEQLQSVITCMSDCPQHVFFTLTKNAPRLRNYKRLMSNNVWVGISSPPDEMYGQEAVNVSSKLRWFDTSLSHLTKVDVPVRWVSLEPMSWTGSYAVEMTRILESHARKLQWAVIGAASNGRDTFQPDIETLKMVAHVLSVHDVPVYLKNNIDRDLALSVFGDYPENYPPQPKELYQRSLL